MRGFNLKFGEVILDSGEGLGNGQYLNIIPCYSFDLAGIYDTGRTDYDLRRHRRVIAEAIQEFCGIDFSFHIATDRFKKEGEFDRLKGEDYEFWRDIREDIGLLPTGPKSH